MLRNLCLYLSLFFVFILGSRNGYIALWKDSEPEPIRIFPYCVHSLPEADRQALERGIRITDETALKNLLEDYLS